MTAKCPKCDNHLSGLDVDQIPAHVGYRTEYKAITLSCPHCHATLGAQIDPLAIFADRDLQSALLDKTRGT